VSLVIITKLQIIAFTIWKDGKFIVQHMW